MEPCFLGCCLLLIFPWFSRIGKKLNFPITSLCGHAHVLESASAFSGVHSGIFWPVRRNTFCCRYENSISTLSEIDWSNTRPFEHDCQWNSSYYNSAEWCWENFALWDWQSNKNKKRKFSKNHLKVICFYINWLLALKCFSWCSRALIWVLTLRAIGLFFRSKSSRIVFSLIKDCNCCSNAIRKMTLVVWSEKKLAVRYS